MTRVKGRWIAFGLLLATLGLAGVALLWSGALDRLVHRQRYATTGTELLDADRYAAAAQARAGTGERVAQLRFPDGKGPVTVALAGAAERVVYLDPPTARVLDVAVIAAGAARLERPVVATRLTAATASDLARALAHGDVLRVNWPTERKPDWIVELRPERGDAATVAVADDAGVAVTVAARAVPARGGGVGAGMVFPLAALLTLLMAAAMWWRTQRAASIRRSFDLPPR